MDLSGPWYGWLSGLLALVGRKPQKQVEYNPYVAKFLNHQVEEAERERSAERNG